MTSSTTSIAARRVRWRTSQVRVMILGASLCLCFTLLVAYHLLRQGRQTLARQSETTSGAALITKHWTTTSGSSTRYWIAFRRPGTNEQENEETLAVSPQWYLAMQPGMRVSTRFVPAAPEANSLSGRKPQLFLRWGLTGGALGIAAVTFVVMLCWSEWRRRQAKFWLVQNGRTAVGEVVDVAETYMIKGGRPVWMYDVQYQFPLPAGEMITALHHTTTGGKQSWPLGEMVTVFFDPANPARHALYNELPGELIGIQ